MNWTRAESWAATVCTFLLWNLAWFLGSVLLIILAVRGGWSR